MKEITAMKRKQIILEILIEIDKYCKENALRYSLAYGTLLGAIRHKGFIPWDDDIDIMIPRPDYNKFIKNFNNRGEKYLIVNDINNTDMYYYPFAKVTDERTIIYENVNFEINRGVYVDIFPIDGYPKSIIKSKILTLKSKLLQYITYGKNIPHNTTNLKYKIFSLFINILFSWISYNRLTRITNILSESYPYNICKYCGVSMSVYGIKDRFTKQMFEEYIDIEFERHIFKAIKKHDVYLSKIYGDYIQLPPEEKRKSTHSAKAYYRN